MVQDLQPYSTVENKGFVGLMQIVAPKYTVPKRTAFSRVVIPDMYESTRIKIQNELQSDLEGEVNFFFKLWFTKNVLKIIVIYRN